LWSRLAASAGLALSGVTDVAARSDRVFREIKQTPLFGAGFLFGGLRKPRRWSGSKGAGQFPPFVFVYQLRKQRWPYGPECQPGGQLYNGRQPPYGPRCPPGPQPPDTGIVAVSVAADRSSGATGMACEADIDARPTPIANKEAASILIGIPFCWYAMK
jgi:hypothetical protein